jgi:uncharacterized membrane protein HdeD (DUF308 family)
MRSFTGRPAVPVALLCAGVVIVTAGLATAHISVTAAGVVAILVGWLTAAGLQGAPRRDGASH